VSTESARLNPTGTQDDAWLNFAIDELERLQGEYRLLQGQSHAVLGVGFALGTAALAASKGISLHLALVIVILAWGLAISWYMNINAESNAVGTARNYLSRRVTDRLKERGDERVTYSDLVASAGVNALGTAAENAVAGVLFLGAVVVGGIVNTHAEDSAAKSFGWPIPVWIAVWALGSLMSVTAIVLSMIENRHYMRRVLGAIAEDDPSGAQSVVARSVADLFVYLKDRDRGLT
jgi:hypothetical protein